MNSSSKKIGHAWVADGYRDIWDCSQGVGYLYFHMNWGWEGNHNGWYSFDSFVPGSNNYSQNKEQIIGIKP